MLRSNPIQDFLRIQRRAHDHVPSVYEHSHRVKLSIKSKPNKIFSIHKFLSIRCVCAKFPPRSDKMFVRSSVGINSNLMFFSHSSRVCIQIHGHVMMSIVFDKFFYLTNLM